MDIYEIINALLENGYQLRKVEPLDDGFCNYQFVKKEEYNTFMSFVKERECVVTEVSLSNLGDEILIDRYVADENGREDVAKFYAHIGNLRINGQACMNTDDYSSIAL